MLAAAQYSVHLLQMRVAKGYHHRLEGAPYTCSGYVMWRGDMNRDMNRDMKRDMNRDMNRLP